MAGVKVLTDSEVHHVLKQALDEESWQLLRCDVKAAAEGLIGFLGDHYRITLHVKVGESVRPVYLFAKTMPRRNADKATFIDQGNFFRREMITFQLFESIGGDDGPNPWRSKAFIYNDSLLVMPDLATHGYSQRHFLSTLDLLHVLSVTASLARFHACYTNHAVKKNSNRHRPYNFIDEYSHIMKDPTFCDSPWLRACSKLSANLLDKFSTKYTKSNTPNLEEKLTKLYIKACVLLKDHEGTLNTLLHKDLWMNNLMFKYEGERPVNAILLDFQCLRFGPPAFDLMLFLYLTTTRSFRDNHEKEVLEHYFSIFMESLNLQSRLWLKEIGYNFEELQSWVEKSRIFGMLEAVAIFPYVLMDPISASRTFDDPSTFKDYNFEDRTAPVMAHCERCPEYCQRQVAVTEEFVERYVVTDG